MILPRRVNGVLNYGAKHFTIIVSPNKCGGPAENIGGIQRQLEAFSKNLPLEEELPKVERGCKSQSANIPPF
jgi:hypothetical protein